MTRPIPRHMSETPRYILFHPSSCSDVTMQRALWLRLRFLCSADRVGYNHPAATRYVFNFERQKHEILLCAVTLRVWMKYHNV